MRHYIGIDIGGTNTTIGLVSEKGSIVIRDEIKIGDFAHRPFIDFLQAIIDSCIALAATHHASIEGVGIGAPNGSIFKGTIEHSDNLPWKDEYQVASIVEEALKCPVRITNDANAAALGEKEFGVAQNLNDFMVITLGTGLGSGIVCGGKVVYGHDGFAGELGHAVVEHEGRDCTCGRRGCLEAYVSIRGIKQTYQELGGTEDEAPADLMVRARKGDVLAKEVFVKTGEWLGLKLADAATYTSPEAFVFFGGIAECSDLFFPAAKATMEANIYNLYSNKIKLLKSSLPANDAAILGSAALVKRSESGTLFD